MLKSIPDFFTADLLWTLAAMGHGDTLTVVDRNFPASSVASDTKSGKSIELPGMNVTDVIEGIVRFLPVDDFLEVPLFCMKPVHSPDSLLEVQNQVHNIVKRAESREVKMVALDRMDFYAMARKSFAVVHTSESRPYGCFVIAKGVVFDS